MKLQILADLNKLIAAKPNKAVVVSMYPMNVEGNIAIQYDGQGMMKAHYLKEGRRSVMSCPWTNDFHVIEQWLAAKGFQMAEYRG